MNRVVKFFRSQIYMLIFDCAGAGVGAPNAHVVGGSAV